MNVLPMELSRYVYFFLLSFIDLCNKNILVFHRPLEVTCTVKEEIYNICLSPE